QPAQVQQECLLLVHRQIVECGLIRRCEIETREPARERGARFISEVAPAHLARCVRAHQSLRARARSISARSFSVKPWKRTPTPRPGLLYTTSAFTITSPSAKGRR